jgi:hypothetical protein
VPAFDYFGEVLYVDPFRLVAAAFAKCARDVTNIFVTLAVFSFADRQIGFATSM